MTQTLTLNARLKILVAKTFRAEKLYSSIHNTQLQGGGAASLAILSEMANDIRAKEWQRAHFQLRTALNELLGHQNGQSLSDAVRELFRSFSQRAGESTAAVDKGNNALVDAAKRHEFAHVLKLSFELIRHRARAQANKAIADELQAVLELSGRELTSSKKAGETLRADHEGERTSVKGDATIRESIEAPADVRLVSNVVPLRRKMAGGSFMR